MCLPDGRRFPTAPCGIRTKLPPGRHTRLWFWSTVCYCFHEKSRMHELKCSSTVGILYKLSYQSFYWISSRKSRGSRDFNENDLKTVSYGLELDSWYEILSQQVQALIQPVSCFRVSMSYLYEWFFSSPTQFPAYIKTK